MKNLTVNQRHIVLTVVVAAVSALLTEHLLKPGVKRKLRI